MATDDLAGWLGSAGLLAISLVLSVLSALLDRSGSIRLRHWAGEAGGRIAALYDRPAEFELFRTLISWGSMSCLLGSLAVAVLAVEPPWTAFSATVLAASLGLLILITEIFSRARIGQDPETALRRVTPIVRGLLILLYPWILLLRPLLPAAAIQRRDDEQPDEATHEEIEAYLRVGEREGILEPGEDEMVRGIVDLGETEVRSVMVPRLDMVTASPVDDPQTLAELFLASGHSRLPVYREEDDQVLGVLHIRDLLQGLQSNPRPAVARLARTPHFVAETARLDDLLRELQSRRQQMAIVVDEYGGTAGLVTVEDLLEEIVGEIRDEHDAVSDPMERLGEGSWRVDGGATLDDLEDLFGVEFTGTSATTVGGLVLELLGRIPSAGESVESHDMTFTVERVRHRRLRSVRVESRRGTASHTRRGVDR